MVVGKPDIYLERASSKTGERRGCQGIGRLQHQTDLVIIPIHDTGARARPCVGKKMTIRIGKPIRVDHYKDAPNEVASQRSITKEVREKLRVMEREAYGEISRDPSTGPAPLDPRLGLTS